MRTLKIYTTILVCAWMITSCEKTKNDDTVSFHLSKGFFIVNEGAFGQSNGEVSFISDDGSQKITKLFKMINSRALGDVIQSMKIIDDKGYIVANNSQKIEVVSMDNFKSIGVITGLSSPRYMLKVSNGKAYVSDWIANNIKIIDLNSNTITGTIATGNGPEQLLMLNDKVYVTNVGGFGNDSTLTVINTLTNTVVTTVQTGVNPNSLSLDANGRLWILCGGTLGPDYLANTADDIGGKLIKMDTATNMVLNTFYFGQGEHPLKITINQNKTKLYFLRGSSAYTGTVCVMDLNATSLPATPLINREFYGLGVNPENENIVGGIGSFSTDSWVLRYNSSGVLSDSLKVGIGPNGFAFN